MTARHTIYRHPETFVATALRRASRWMGRHIFQSMSLDDYVTDHYDSVLIGSMATTEGEPDFEPAAREALALIERSDPAAWNLVQRQVTYLMSAHLMSGGCYNPFGRVCAVDFERCYKNRNTGDMHAYYHDWYVASLASTVVHEATHGRLFELGIPYNVRTRERVERLCRARERRFVARLHSEHYDMMSVAPPFDPADWQPYWQFGKRLIWGAKLIARVLRDT